MGGQVDPKWIVNKINEVPTGTIDGVNAVFTLSQSPANTAELEVYLDGLFEDDYSFNPSTNEITLNTAPALGQQIKAVYRPSA